MSELVITAAGFVIQPLVDLRDGPAVIRWAYNRSFLTNDNIQVQWGSLNKGFGVETPCSIASGLVTVDQDTTLWTTDDASDTSPLSIGVSAWLLTARGKLIQQLQIANKTQWVVPVSLAPTTTWADFSIYNQATALYYYNPNYLNAPQTVALIDNSFDQHPASDTELGTVLLTVPADTPAQPVVWGANDPLVRDAIAIQGIDVAEDAPSDSQVLAYNQAANQWEPQNNAAGDGNVVSNEVSSVDSQIVLASGTGGKTIKFYEDDGLVRTTDGVPAPATVGTTDLDNDAVTYAKIQNVTDARLLGRSAGSSGDVQEITVGAGLQLSAGALTNTVTDTGITQLTGDVTAGPGSGSQAATIPNDTVTYAKMQNVSAADRILGRGNGGGSGDVQEISLGTNLTMSGTTLNASAGTGTVGNVGTLTSNQLIIGQGGTDVAALGSLGTTTTLLHGNAAGAPTFGAVSLTADVSGDLPLSNLAQASAASKLLGRGDSGAGDYQEITLGTNLSMSGTTLNAAGGSSTFVGGGFEQYRIIGQNPRGGTTSTDLVGVSTIAAQNDSAANADDVSGTYIRRNTAASTNADAGYDWNIASLVCLGFLPQISTKFKTGSSIAVCRVWCGAFSGTPMASDDPVLNGIGFRYSTSAGDTTWKAYSNDASGGGTITDTGVTVSTATLYNFVVRAESTTSVKYYISTDNGVTYTLVATHSTNLPAAASLMGFHFFIRTLENVAKFISFSWAYIREL